MKIKISKNKIVIAILLFLLYLWSGSPYQTIFPIVLKLQIPVAGICLVDLLARSKGRNKTSLYVFPMIIFGLMIFLTWVSHFFVSTAYYINDLSSIFIAYYITYVIDFEKLKTVFLKFMEVFSVISLVGFFLLNSTSLLNNLPKLYNVNNVEYGIGVVFNYLTHLLDRNTGIFWEPGIFASFLSIALIFEICYKNGKSSWYRIVLFSITIITTNSAAGFVLLALSIMLIFVYKNKYYKGFLRGVVSNVALILSIFLLLNMDSIVMQIGWLSENKYIQKLLSENILSSGRYLGIFHNLHIFSLEPLFGAGIITVSRNMRFVADISTSTYLMSLYGILGASFTVFWIFGILRQKFLNYQAKIVVLIMTLIMINKETHIDIMFTWCLLFYFLKQDVSGLNNRDYLVEKK